MFGRVLNTPHKMIKDFIDFSRDFLDDYDLSIQCSLCFCKTEGRSKFFLFGFYLFFNKGPLFHYLLKFRNICRGVFRTQSKIYDGIFFEKIANA